ncbi:hypothetical protein ACFP63_08725 [Oerskovia jenensis]|uniref:Transcriptional regulator n=1 Tax=Oerskovia jenensis TaxID=162169 RepID=A0ABS2LI88_9CELL|nr:hypothetical protein [Oerskovia jenensis]MBM7480136.1 hypothetical protein [Oerskovia jenensis]
MQCVRADRREAEGRPAQWQQRQARVLFVRFPPPDFSRLERALREMGNAAQRKLLMMREAQGILSETAPTPAQLARATELSPYIVPGSLRIGRGA